MRIHYKHITVTFFFLSFRVPLISFHNDASYYFTDRLCSYALLNYTHSK